VKTWLREESRVKRLLIGMIVAVMTISFGAASAGCGPANRGGSAGPYDRAYTAFGSVEIYAQQYGSFAGGPAYLCSNGDGGVEPAARGYFEIKVNGSVVCMSTQRLSSDPFGFGAGVHSPATDACGADMTWDGFDAMFEPGDVDASAEGVAIAMRKNTPVEGTYRYGGNTYTIPFDAVGWFTRGARAASEH
jgi:hypothetical protein